MEARTRHREQARTARALALAVLVATGGAQGATPKAECQNAFMRSPAAATCTLVAARAEGDAMCTYRMRCLTLEGTKAELAARVRKGAEHALRNCNGRAFLRPCPYEVSVERACRQRFAHAPAAKWCTHITSGQAAGGGERCQITATCPEGAGRDAPARRSVSKQSTRWSLAGDGSRGHARG